MTRPGPDRTSPGSQEPPRIGRGPSALIWRWWNLLLLLPVLMLITPWFNKERPQLAGLPFHPEPIFKLTEGQYETQLQRLNEREDLVFGNAEGPAVDLDDVSASLYSPLHDDQCNTSRAEQ